MNALDPLSFAKRHMKAYCLAQTVDERQAHCDHDDVLVYSSPEFDYDCSSLWAAGQVKELALNRVDADQSFQF